ncbi:hypothetical protein [Streptomyces sp. NRRL B-1347]|uniref:hypothetical protein n=1 Tax=Streptomyces sp. NRRL B-1347 TaxID=1476877 RepID=UPI00068F9A56|nr:hypothetical protein [Streptomyces sp. NRRL B-1347]
MADSTFRSLRALCTELSRTAARTVLRSSAHWPLSRTRLLLTYTDPETARVRTLPVRYCRSADGEDIRVLVEDARRENWWRSLRPAAPVRLRLRGRTVDATAEVLDSSLLPQEARAELMAYRQQRPRARVAHGGVVMVRLRPRSRSAPRAGEATNRRIVVPRFGGPRTFRLVEEAIPEPGFGEVRVAVAAAEVNFTDVLLREGIYPGGPKPPSPPATTWSARSTPSGRGSRTGQPDSRWRL